MIKIRIDNILFLQEIIYEKTGGDKGIRDENLLDLSLKSCYQTFEKKELFPSIEEKAAKLCISIISNHVFTDGNKRIGLLAMLTFLEINSVNLEFTDNEIINIGLKIASGNMNYDTLLGIIREHKN